MRVSATAKYLRASTRKTRLVTEARDQVLTTFFSLRLFIASTRPWRRSSMNGPFLIERDKVSSSLYLR